jgi:hypothetical protein
MHCMYRQQITFALLKEAITKLYYFIAPIGISGIKICSGSTLCLMSANTGHYQYGFWRSKTCINNYCFGIKKLFSLPTPLSEWYSSSSVTVTRKNSPNDHFVWHLGDRIFCSPPSLSNCNWMKLRVEYNTIHIYSLVYIAYRMKAGGARHVGIMKYDHTRSVWVSPISSWSCAWSL